MGSIEIGPVGLPVANKRSIRDKLDRAVSERIAFLWRCRPVPKGFATQMTGVLCGVHMARQRHVALHAAWHGCHVRYQRLSARATRHRPCSNSWRHGRHLSTGAKETKSRVQKSSFCSLQGGGGLSACRVVSCVPPADGRAEETSYEFPARATEDDPKHASNDCIVVRRDTAWFQNLITTFFLFKKYSLQW
jgi:hypothetical protein